MRGVMTAVPMSPGLLMCLIKPSMARWAPRLVPLHIKAVRAELALDLISVGVVVRPLARTAAAVDAEVETGRTSPSLDAVVQAAVANRGPDPAVVVRAEAKAGR